MKLLSILLLTVTIYFTYQQKATETRKGVIFNLYQRILQTERFVKLDLLVPFPQYDQKVDGRLANLTNEIEQLWTKDNYGCPLNYTNMTENTHGLRWIAQQVANENVAAQLDIAILKGELDKLLRYETDNQFNFESRRKRGVALAAAAAASVLGLGLGAGDKVLCVIKSVFGGCDKRIGENRENLKLAIQHMNQLSTDIQQIATKTNDKFYVVAGELKDIKRAQDQIIQTQNENWEMAEKQFAVLRQNTHHMRNCVQFLYVREQTNHHALMLSNLFQVIFTNIKSYRAALYAFRVNLLNSLTPLKNSFLPMSLIPREQLYKVLQIVQLMESGKQDRLTLAIPSQDMLSYYETKLITNVRATDAGLLLTLAIPMASSTTAMNVIKAIPMPMPDGQTGRAYIFRLETKYIGISSDYKEVALLTDDELDSCIGSSRYAVCSKAIPTETSKSSCLATLYYHDDETLALRNCQVDLVDLPLTEQAINLGFGRWMIMSAKDNYRLVETSTNGSNPLGKREHMGCRVCIITLACGPQLQGEIIHLRSDLSSCEHEPKLRIDVKLPDPLSTMFSLLPPLEELPHFSSMTEAKKQLLIEAQPQLQYLPMTRSNEAVRQIAEPIIRKLTIMKPKFSEKFEQYIPWKMSLLFGFLSFLFSICLHLGYSQLLHKWSKLHRRFPFRITHEGRKIKTKPVQVVSMHDYEYLQDHPEHPLHKCSLILPVEMTGQNLESTTDEQPAVPKNPYTFLRSYIRKLKADQQTSAPRQCSTQPVYSAIPDQSTNIPQYSGYPMNTIKIGTA